MSEEIKVSVCCITYNQEKYIGKTLEGMVNQKTNFAFEILVHDDASTDRTPYIIKEYQQKYPKLIKPIFQSENQYSKKIRISNTFLYPLVKGKYTCLCEGDDYWCDNDKLQKQYDAMEKHPECSICVHYVQRIYENGKIMKNKLIPNRRINGGVVECSQYAQWLLAELIYPFQTSSYCIRSELIHMMEYSRLPEFFKASPVGDEAIQRFCLNYGKAFFIDEVMSCYRVNSIGCWNLRENNSFEKKKEHCERMKRMDQLYNEFSDGKYQEYILEGNIKRDFLLLADSKQYKMLKREEYKEIWQKVRTLTKIKYTLYAYFPFLEKIEKKIRKR